MSFLTLWLIYDENSKVSILSTSFSLHWYTVVSLGLCSFQVSSSAPSSLPITSSHLLFVCILLAGPANLYCLSSFQLCNTHPKKAFPWLLFWTSIAAAKTLMGIFVKNITGQLLIINENCQRGRNNEMGEWKQNHSMKNGFRMKTQEAPSTLPPPTHSAGILLLGNGVLWLRFVTADLLEETSHIAMTSVVFVVCLLSLFPWRGFREVNTDHKGQGKLQSKHMGLSVVKNAPGVGA